MRLTSLAAQVEAQVKSKSPSNDNGIGQNVPDIQVSSEQENVGGVTQHGLNEMGTQNGLSYNFNEGLNESTQLDEPFSIPTGVGSDYQPNVMSTSDAGVGIDDSFSWEMIGLGLEEPMPTQEAVNEL